MTSDEVARKLLLPPAYFLIALVVTIVVARVSRGWSVANLAVNVMGGVLLVAGLAINLVADKAFKSSGTTVKPFEESSALVTSGVFRFSRNPMYVGIVLMLVGVSLLNGSIIGLIPALLLAVFLDRRFIRAEEMMLAEKFGDAWQTYAAQTRRWL